MNLNKATTQFKLNDPKMGPDDMALHLLKTWFSSAESALAKEPEDLTELEKFALARSCGAKVFSGTDDYGTTMKWQTEPVSFVKDDNKWFCYVIRDGKPVVIATKTVPPK